MASKLCVLHLMLDQSKPERLGRCQFTNILLSRGFSTMSKHKTPDRCSTTRPQPEQLAPTSPTLSARRLFKCVAVLANGYARWASPIGRSAPHMVGATHSSRLPPGTASPTGCQMRSQATRLQQRAELMEPRRWKTWRMHYSTSLVTKSIERSTAITTRNIKAGAPHLPTPR